MAFRRPGTKQKQLPICNRLRRITLDPIWFRKGARGRFSREYCADFTLQIRRELHMSCRVSGNSRREAFILRIKELKHVYTRLFQA